jgi:hypothetical protein
VFLLAADEEPEFDGMGRTQWVISPFPVPRLPAAIARVFGTGVPADVRSAPAAPAPEVETSSWLEVEAGVPGIRFRIPPDLTAAAYNYPDPSVPGVGEVLVALWEDGSRSLAIWLGGKSELPIGVYGIRQRPIRREWTQSEDRISGRDVAIAAFRVSLRGMPAVYEVLACWPVSRGRWMRAAARATTRAHQEQFLAALRTLEIDE